MLSVGGYVYFNETERYLREGLVIMEEIIAAITQLDPKRDDELMEWWAGLSDREKFATVVSLALIADHLSDKEERAALNIYVAATNPDPEET